MKSRFINAFVIDRHIESVIEFGCGDGRQLTLANYPRYLGFDVSESAIEMCRGRFSLDSTKEFRLMSEYGGENADLVLSLDVIYHLVEDEVFETYMRTLFGAAQRFVIIYSSNSNRNPCVLSSHVRHRQFTDWTAANAPRWQVVDSQPGYYGADFYAFQMSSNGMREQ